MDRRRSADGGVHWTIPLPNAFGVEVLNRALAFNARKYADGSVSGHFEYHQVVEGTDYRFNGRFPARPTKHVTVPLSRSSWPPAPHPRRVC